MVPFFPFFGKGSPLKSSNQKKGCPFFPWKSTVHLSCMCLRDGCLLDAKEPVQPVRVVGDARTLKPHSLFAAAANSALERLVQYPLQALGPVACIPIQCASGFLVSSFIHLCRFGGYQVYPYSHQHGTCGRIPERSVSSWRDSLVRCHVSEREGRVFFVFFRKSKRKTCRS